MSIHYYILDIESTGLSVDNHEINEISVLRVSDSAQYTTEVKVKNPNVFSPQALEVQGKTKADLLRGISIEEAIEAIEMFLAEDEQKKGGRCIIAHNAPFDRKFCHRAWDEADKEFPADLWLDTMTFAKRYVKSNANGHKIAEAQDKAGVLNIKPDKKTNRLKPKFGLNNFMLGIGLKPKVGAHSAEVDVQNTESMYNFLMESKTEYVSLISRIPHKDDPKPELDMDDAY